MDKAWGLFVEKNNWRESLHRIRFLGSKPCFIACWSENVDILLDKRGVGRVSGVSECPFDGWYDLSCRKVQRKGEACVLILLKYVKKLIIESVYLKVV